MIIQTISDQLKQEIVHDIIEATGSTVTFVASSGLVLCTACAGVDPFCTTCSGNVMIDQVYTADRTASIRWKAADQKRYRPEGQYYDGDCLIVIAYDDQLETVIRQSRFVLVDNRQCTINNYFRKGSPINRFTIVLREDEAVDGHRIG